ncbi:hypothetical protein K0M31_000594 [Melipona bicolor]|uniref:Uncharacterized protein n=1 Tax=Melipona bicolor TaxID=60889 RepID=A0AA40KWZ4_9HYME|nr:hypothetical protein K0M31_000594 [Melipona bicolor]
MDRDDPPRIRRPIQTVAKSKAMARCWQRESQKAAVVGERVNGKRKVVREAAGRGRLGRQRLDNFAIEFSSDFWHPEASSPRRSGT